MKKIYKLSYSNKFFAFFILLIQLAVLYFGFLWFHSGALIYASYALSAVLLVWEINRTEEPTFKLTWVLLIAVIPVFGALLYLFLQMSGKTMSLGIRAGLERARKHTELCLPQDEAVMQRISLHSKETEGFVKYLRKNGGSPAFCGTSAQYFDEGEKILNAMKHEIESAKDFIFMEFFIIDPRGRLWNDFLTLLQKKANEGVEVRILYDGMGCMGLLPRNYPAKMKNKSLTFKIFAPAQPLLSTYQNNRDHRKILIVDGRCVFTGGINLADEYANYIERFGYWKDNGVKLTGAAAAGFTGMFLEMWNFDNPDSENYEKYIKASKQYATQDSGIVVPFGDSPLDDVSVGKRAYIELLNTARKYAHITSPYLVIDNEMYEAMKYAAQRGVDVKLILPHIPDKVYAFWLARTYYPELLEAGIKIYEYTPGFIHAKMSVCDDERAIIGTINHDYRSLYLHYECAAFIENLPAVLDAEEDFQNTLRQSEEITLERYKSFPWYTRLLGRTIRLVAPLL